MMRQTSTLFAPAPDWVAPALAATCAMLVGIGLARFAYTPLIPAVVAAGWFDGAGAAYIGAANLGGYLAGAVIGHRFAGARAVGVLRLMMLVAALSFITCAWPLNFWWLFGWRFVSGFAGAVIMVLAAPQVLRVVPSQRLGLAGGMIFAGVGAGIVVSGTLVPALIAESLESAWLVLGGLCALLTVAVWRLWPADDTHRDRPLPSTQPAPTGLGTAIRQAGIRSIIVQYGLIAAALVPHMVFLVDYVARGLGHGLAVGAVYWVLFGAAAIAGPVLAGRLADRIGFRAAYRGGLIAHVGCTAWLAASESMAALVVSSLVAGAAVPGFTALALGRIREVMTGAHQQAAWGRATLAFALMQATAGFGCSALFDWHASYVLLFAIAAGAALLALVIDILWPGKPQMTPSEA